MKFCNPCYVGNPCDITYFPSVKFKYLLFTFRVVQNMEKTLKTILDIHKHFKLFHSSSILHFNLPKHPQLDVDYVCNPQNVETIERNILYRKGVGNVKLVNELKQKLDKSNSLSNSYEDIKKKFYDELYRIPNRTHPDVMNYGDQPKVVKITNSKVNSDLKRKEFYEISKRLNLVRTDQLGNVSGSRSYFVMGEMAELEQALVNFFVEKLMKNGFELISVPDLLPRDVIERCGMYTRGERNQVYALDEKLHGPDVCLSGTSEMALAGFLNDEVFPEKRLPIKLAAVSRCYRAETSSVAEEKGIYRVHEFNKVEMFLVTTPESSDEALEEIRRLQEANFEALGLHFQVLDMPPHELGAQAYRKYDIEAWMPGRGIFGEISSCSNCTDYQSRRLNIKYETAKGEVKFVHTLNGTACAVPRLLIALTENFQDEKGVIHIPEVLRGYMRGKSFITRQKNIPELKLVKNKKET